MDDCIMAHSKFLQCIDEHRYENAHVSFLLKDEFNNIPGRITQIIYYKLMQRNWTSGPN